MTEATIKAGPAAVEVHDPLAAHRRPTSRIVEVPITMLATVLALGAHKYRVSGGGLPPDARVASAWVDVDRAGTLVISLRVESRMWEGEAVLDRYSPAARAPARPVLLQLGEKEKEKEKGDTKAASSSMTARRLRGSVTGTVTSTPPVETPEP